MLHDPTDSFLMNGKLGTHSPNHMTLPMQMHDGSTPLAMRLDVESPQNQPLRAPVGLSPSSSSTTSGLQEPDAVIASHHAWPFFQCNRVEQYAFYPPKTARNQATWHAWTAQVDERSLDIATERKILTEP